MCLEEVIHPGNEASCSLDLIKKTEEEEEEDIEKEKEISSEEIGILLR